MKVSVFGLGYVGAVSCACLPELGHDVVGVDINPLKVELIASGQSPVVEEGIEELIAALRLVSAAAGKADEVRGGDEQDGDEDAAFHAHSISGCEGPERSLLFWPPWRQRPSKSWTGT